MADVIEDRIALIDLDGTVADYDSALRDAMRTLQSPDEPPYAQRHHEPPHVEARRKMIQRQPGFWRTLKRLPLGFEVVEELRSLGFVLHVLTKGPSTTPSAWSEKVEWCREHLPDALVTVTSDKSLVYGRVLFDDFPPYFAPWLAVRPRGLVVCVAHPWNEGYANGGPEEHERVLRYDGSNRDELRARLVRAFDRGSREAL
jgi:5'(3')-deoxyribonucleotidase